MATEQISSRQIDKYFKKGIGAFIKESNQVSAGLKELFSSIPEVDYPPERINEKLKAFIVALGAIVLVKGVVHDDSINADDMNKAFDAINKTHANWRNQPQVDVNTKANKTK